MSRKAKSVKSEKPKKLIYLKWLHPKNAILKEAQEKSGDIYLNRDFGGHLQIPKE